MKFICRIIKHDFEEFEDGFKRRCKRCAREEWIFSKDHPKVGEPKYFWKEVNWMKKF